MVKAEMPGTPSPTFYPRDAMHSAVFATATCLSVCLSVTRRYSWARTRGAQLSAGYTVNTYSKPHLYDASTCKCGNVNDSADSLSFIQQQQQKTSALGAP